MSKDLRVCPGVGARKCGAFLAPLDRDPHPTCTRCRGKVCTRDMTCDFCAVWSAEQWELFAKKRSYKERKQRPSGSAPPAQQTSPRAETSSGVSRPGTSSSSSSRPLGRQEKQGWSRGAPGVVLGGAPSPPARPRSSERCGSASRHSSGAGGLAPSSPPPSGGGGAGVARSRQTPLSRVSESVDSPQFSPHVPRRENSRESSVSCSRVLSSRDSRSSGRESRKDKRARSREGSSRGRRRRSRSCSSSRSLSRGRERVRRSSSASRSSRGRSRRERSRSSDRYRSRRGSSRSCRDRSRSSDRYRSRRDRSRRERSRSFDRYRSRRERTRSPARRGERRNRSRSHTLPSRSRDCSLSGGRLPASPARLRAEEAGRLARRGAQEGVEAVASQPPVAPGGAAGVTPVAGGAPMTALPSAMQELAKFFLNLSGSSSLGATGDLAGVTASAAASGGYRVSLFDCCWSGHYLCCGCDACWGWRFCLLLPLLFLACLVNSSVRVNPALAGVAVARLVRGPTDVLRSAPEGGLLLLNALRVIGGSAIALPQIRLRRTELTLLLPDPGMRMEVRVLVALPGILTARGLLQGKSVTGLGLVIDRLGLRAWLMMTAPLPSSR